MQRSNPSARDFSRASRTAAVVALLVPAAAVLSLASSFGSHGQASAPASGGVRVPSDLHYRRIVDLLSARPGTRLKSLTVTGIDGSVEFERAKGRSGFPVQYLNPLGVVEIARSLMGIDESISIREMRLAQGENGRLVWHLDGLRDDVGAWSAEITPNGTGLRTVKHPHPDRAGYKE